MGCELSILNVWLVSGASRRSRWFRPKRTASAASVVTLKASSLYRSACSRCSRLPIIQVLYIDGQGRKKNKKRYVYSSQQGKAIRFPCLLSSNTTVPYNSHKTLKASA